MSAKENVNLVSADRQQLALFMYSLANLVSDSYFIVNFTSGSFITVFVLGIIFGWLFIKSKNI